MKNKIIKLKSYKELDIEKYKKDNFYIVELDGKKMRSLYDFFVSMKIGFNLPDDADEGWDQFNDWMTDFTWIDENRGICLIIYNSKSFLPWSFKQFESHFKGRYGYLHFWEKDAPKIILDGKTRKFNVYLVEDINLNGNIVDYEPTTFWQEIKGIFTGNDSGESK